MIVASLSRLLIISLCLILANCKKTVEVEEGIKWEKIELFDQLSIHYIKVINNRIFVSAVDESEPIFVNIPQRAKLYSSEDGVNWELLKTSSFYAGPITYADGTYYWVADTIHTTQDFDSWGAIVNTDDLGRTSPLYPDALNDIVVWEETLYGSNIYSDTYIIEDGIDIQRVDFNEISYGGARRYHTLSNGEIIAIQNSGYVVYSDRPFFFRVPNGEYLDGDWIPDSSSSIASITAFQEHQNTFYGASNFPELVRIYENGKWVAVTDTIPTTKYTDIVGRARNWVLYITFLNDEMYISTRVGGVLKWDTIENKWVHVRDGLPKREIPNSIVDDLYYQPQHFDSFNEYLFAGYGFLDATSDPTEIPRIKHGLYKLKIE